MCEFLSAPRVRIKPRCRTFPIRCGAIKARMDIEELSIGLEKPPHLTLEGAALFLDLDGTLAPIVERPQDVGPTRVGQGCCSGCRAASTAGWRW